ncbi:TlpA family protein disulfide reductase [Thermogutta sp.]|uniref:TlpA family protein disulfide reductase n=1 Tax=Thermogutta sp. TaxID=1962930 RepID=UPI003C7DF89B
MMRCQRHRRTELLFTFCLVLGIGLLVTLGCPRPASQERPKASGQQVSSQSIANPSTPKQPATEMRESATPQVPVSEPAPKSELKIPSVVMAEVDRAQCKLFVGDVIPTAVLPNLEGQETDIKQLLGNEGTVLVFFSVGEGQRERLLASNLLGDLQEDIVKTHGSSGVSVIAIHVADDKGRLAALVKDAQVEFPVLVDRDGKYYGQFALHSPPALYLLDSSGKILWLDIEYSRATRENLKQAVEALVAKKS